VGTEGADACHAGPWNKGGLERLEQRLRAITNELARGFKIDPNQPPYPGIHAFEREDAGQLHGVDP
jgi:hypothetical protein